MLFVFAFSNEVQIKTKTCIEISMIKINSLTQGKGKQTDYNY